MLLHDSPLFRIYFGNAQDRLHPDWYLALPPDKPILTVAPFTELKKFMRISGLMFLKQIHSAQGYLHSDTDFSIKVPFSVEGDYLVTAVRQAGLGIMSADCLPIVYFDSLNNVIAIMHAGWKGSVQHIAVKTLQQMSATFGTEPEHLRIFFGPSAKNCCYQVKPDFIKQLENFAFANQVLHEHTDFLTFDLPGFNRLQLENAGVPKEAFHFDYNICTICDKNFFSSRRHDGGRQMTVVCLK